MWDAYWETIRSSTMDWLILALGGFLVGAHLFLLLMRWHGRRVRFVQSLHRYQEVCLALTDLLPVLGLLGTVLSLMNTFKALQTEDGIVDLGSTIRTFAPALSTTLSGLIMIAINLPLNAVLWLARPESEKEQN